MVSFLKLPAEKKTQFFLNLKQIFGPSYIVKALSKHALLLNRSLKVGSKKLFFTAKLFPCRNLQFFSDQYFISTRKGRL